MKSASILLSAALLPILSLALGACAPVDSSDSPDSVDSSEEDVSTASESIINGTSVTAQYPEAATIVGTGGTVPSWDAWRCSAALIAPRVILTAGHCVDGPTTWQVNVGAQSRTTTRAATFDWKNETSVNPAHHDVGLLFLNQAIVLASYPTIATAPASPTSKVMNVGRVHNGITNTLWGAVTTNLINGATVSPGFPFVYFATDVLESGDSGGPDFLFGTHQIIAVNSFSTTLTNSQGSAPYEGLARVDQINQWITRPIDDAKFFVQQVYLDVLRNEPDPGGLTYWTNVLTACNGAAACVAQTRVAVARAILESPENVLQDPDLNPASTGYKSAYVTHCYTNFLQRQPAAAERDYWLKFLSSTGDYSSVVSGFITSPEYRQRFGAQ